MTPLAWLLLPTVFFTSLLSGVFGMAGGLLLMAVLASVLSPTEALALHGLVQLTANGSRCWLLRRDALVGLAVPQLAGGALALAVVGALGIVPPRAVLLVLLGILAVAGVLLPKPPRVPLERPLVGTGVGLVVTSAQLLAGASGPLLDLAWLRSGRNRLEIVATKALTQSAGHLLKVGWHGGLVLAGGERLQDAASLAWLGLLLLLALAGTWTGRRLLEELAEADFRRHAERLVLVLGLACLAQGVLLTRA